MMEDLEGALTGPNRYFELVARLAVAERHEELVIVRAPAQADVDPVADAAVQLTDGDGGVHAGIVAALAPPAIRSSRDR